MSGASGSAGASSDPGRAAIVVAHPGHELMVYAWMERHRPLYFCLTDGSGSTGTSRVASSLRLLERIGASVGPICGRHPDREIYRLLLDERVEAFVDLAGELARALVAAGVDYVAGDAAEGFNPMHDVCRFVIDGAVALVRRDTGRVIRNYDFVLDADPATCPEPLRGGALWLFLDDAAMERKRRAATAYPEMRAEVQAALDRFGADAFAVEGLRPAVTPSPTARLEDEVPGYEHFGTARVDQGLYREVIRYREHVLPVQAALAASVR